jgi:hypothetical protein
VQRAGEDAALLREVCAVRPAFALARGRPPVRRALHAASLLGSAVVRWIAPDSSAVWIAFPAAGTPSGAAPTPRVPAR